MTIVMPSVEMYALQLRHLAPQLHPDAGMQSTSEVVTRACNKLKSTSLHLFDGSFK